MSELVTINQASCTGCGLCVEVCPYRIISLDREKAVVADEKCFFCGHCRAVCPAGAVEIAALPGAVALASLAQEAVEERPDKVRLAALAALMESRRSCRNYRADRVAEILLFDLVRIGTLAPSGTNSQGWEFTVFPERADVELLGDLVAGYYRKLNRLAALPFLRNFLKWVGQNSLWKYRENYYDSVTEALLEWKTGRVDRLFHGATAIIIISSKNDASCPAEDALLATQNIVLAAETMGLGSCLIGFAVEAIRRSPLIKKKVGIPETEQVYSVICLGYPAVKFLRAAGRREVRPRVVRKEPVRVH